MSDFKEKLQELRLKASGDVLGLGDEETNKLILKETNRARFFLQEAADLLSKEAQNTFDLRGVNILQELTRESIGESFKEQTVVFSKLLRFLHEGEPSYELRESLTDLLASYTEALAKLRGFVVGYSIAELS